MFQGWNRSSSLEIARSNVRMKFVPAGEGSSNPGRQQTHPKILDPATDIDA